MKPAKRNPKFRLAAGLLLLLLPLTLAADPAHARRRTSYNDDYLIRVSEEDAQRPLDEAVNKALRTRARGNAEILSLQGKLTNMNTERKDLTEKIIELRRQELQFTQVISAYQRQKRNNDWRIKDLEAHLQRME